MSGLPAALAPWAAQLSGFAPELAVSLGAWARRLAPAVGPLRAVAGAAGEPDGLSGLARRGPYERLLASEWLLADAVPHEFLRRAAAGEHLFLARGTRRLGAARRSMALVDAGPDQLGTPRLAQLALLVVLAARADGAGIPFTWGIAQDPDAGLVEGFGAAQAPRFLAARTARAPDAAALRAWSEALPAPRAPDDLWLLGGPALVALAPERASWASIEDAIDPGAREVRVQVRRAGGRAEVSLPLPDPADCTRLLRDPFREAVAAPTMVGGGIVPEAGVVWAPSGRRLAARLRDGAMLDAHVPSSPRELPGRVRRHEADALFAFGWCGKRQPIRVTVRGADLLVDLGHRRPVRARVGAGVVLHAPGGPRSMLAPCHVFPGSAREVLIPHPAGLLYAVSTGEPEPEVSIVETGVTSFAAVGGNAAYVTSDGPTLALVLLRPGKSRAAWPLGAGTGRAFLSTDRGSVLVSREETDGSWALHRLRPEVGELEVLSRWSLRPPAQTSVVGVTLVAGKPALVLLEEDRRDFTILDERGSRLVHGASAPVVAAAVSPGQAAFAYTTRAGALVVYSLARAAVVLELVPGQGHRAAQEATS